LSPSSLAQETGGIERSASSIVARKRRNTWAGEHMTSGERMTKAYYSNVFPQSADHIWSIIRDFNNYPVWVDGTADSHIEAAKSGDTANAVRGVM
jgi:hypothetical protein